MKYIIGILIVFYCISCTTKYRCKNLVTKCITIKNLDNGYKNGDTVISYSSSDIFQQKGFICAPKLIILNKVK